MLVIEDDPVIREALRDGLSRLGHDVTDEGTGLGGMRRLVADPSAVTILDLGLPDIDGLVLLGMLRSVATGPVIVATARDAEEFIIAALDAGADDYVVKPFSAAQIDARVRAVLRRVDPPPLSPTGSAPIVVGDLVIEPASRVVTLAGRPLLLSRKEFDLLLALARRAGRIVTKRQLLAEVWGQPYGGPDKTVDVHLSWLRNKLGESGAAPRFLLSVRGVGVKLVNPEAGCETEA
jgi:DNA-binding response OmpR family regulator